MNAWINAWRSADLLQHLHVALPYVRTRKHQNSCPGYPAGPACHPYRHSGGVSVKHWANAGVDAGMGEVAGQHLGVALHHVGAHKHPELGVRDAPAALQAARRRHKVLDRRQLVAGDGALLAIALQPPAAHLSLTHAAAHLQGQSMQREERP